MALSENHKVSTGFFARMVWAETKASLNHFRILLLCLFLGVFVIGLVQASTASIENGLRKEGKAILGGDLAVRNIYNPLPDEAISYLDNQGALTKTIEMRGLIRNKQTGQTALSEIKAVDAAYPLFGQFKIADQEKAIQPAKILNEKEQPSLLIESALSERLEASKGDAVTIGEQDFIVAGIIASEPDRAGGSTFAVGPRTLLSLSDMGKTGLILEGAQIYYHYKLALDNPEALQAVQQEFKEKFTGGGWRLLDYTNASPTIQSFLDRLSLFFTLVGLSALLIGGVGIGNAVRVVLQKRMSALAVMKSLGGSGRFVFRLWLGILMLTACLAIIPALIISFGLPFAFSGSIQNLLPVPVAPSLDLANIALTMVLGFTILILFSWLPLAKAVQTKPALLLRQGAGQGRLQGRASAGHYIFVTLLLAGLCALLIASMGYPYFTAVFLGAVVGIYVLLKILGWGLVQALSWFRKSRFLSLRLAVLQITSERAQTFTVLLSLGLALTLFTAISLIEYNIKQRIDRDIPSDAPAFFFIDIQKSQMPEFEALMGEIDGVSDFNKVPNLRGRILEINGKPAAQALVDESEGWLLRGDRGFTYLDEKPDYSELLEGQWWDANYQGPPIISVVEDVAQGFGIGVGDTMTLSVLGRDVEAEIASVRTVDWSTMTINYAITFAPGFLENAPHSYLATIQAPRDLETDILNAVARDFPNVTAIQVRDALQTASTILSQIALAMRVIAGLALLTGILVLMASLLSTMRERRYNHVIMKVLGTRRALMMKTVLSEFSALGLLAGIVALIAGTVAAYFTITTMMDMDWRFNINLAIGVIIVSLLITLSFASLALWRLFKIRPIEYLRNE